MKTAVEETAEVSTENGPEGLDRFDLVTFKDGVTGYQQNIDGVTYQVRPLLGRAGIRLGVELTKRLAKTFGDIELPPEREGEATQASDYLALATSISENLNTEQFMKVMGQFSGVTQHIEVMADGTEVPHSLSVHNAKTAQAFDIHFAGKSMRMLKWLAFAFEVSFSDFLGMGALIEQSPIGRAVKKALSEDASKNPKASTGHSGESSTKPE